NNNIFHNARTNLGGSGTHYAILLPGDENINSCDYNILIANGSGGVLGSFSASDYSNISDWRSASDFDNNSSEVIPEYIDVTGDADDIDLHLDPAGSVNNTNLASSGT